jgi:hypothetical protein
LKNRAQIRDTHDRAENARLSAAFRYNDELRGDAGRKEYAENKAYSDILEAMLFEGLQTLLKDSNDVEVVLPSEFDDRKSAVDVLIVVKNADGSVSSAIGLDATTETDVDGYIDEAGNRKKGIDEKMRRTYRTLWTPFNNLVRVKYARVAGRVQMVEDMPRLLAGASKNAVASAAEQFVAGTLDPKTHPLFVQMMQSVMPQLGAIGRAISEKKGLTETEVREKEVLKKTFTDLKARLPKFGKVNVTDPVVLRVIGTVDSYKKRIDERAQAKVDQQAFNPIMMTGGDRKKAPDAPLTKEEQEKLNTYFKETKVDPAIEKALRDFLTGTRKHFDPKWIDAVAGGIPTRLFSRLGAAPAPTVESPKDEKEEEKKGDPHLADKKAPEHPPHPAPHGAHGPDAHGAHDAHHGHADVHGHMAAIAKARAGLGLSASHGHDAHGGGHDAHGGGHAGAHGHESHGHGGGVEKYQSKWKRAWSKTKELVLRRFAGLGGGVIGTGIGTLACMGFWTVLPAFAGAALSQWGLNKWFKKKGYDKKFEARDKIAALESLEKDMKAMPWSWRHKFEQAAKKGEDKDTWIQNELVARAKWSRLRRNVLSAAVGGAAGLEFGSVAKSGESLFFKRLPEVAQGKRSWSDAWGVFCAGDWWNRRPAPRGPLGAPGVHGPGTGRNGFVPLTRGGFVDPFNQFDGARRRPTFRELMGCCLQQNTELARVDNQGNPWYRIRTTVPGAARPGHIAGLASGRWN